MRIEQGKAVHKLSTAGIPQQVDLMGIGNTVFPQHFEKKKQGEVSTAFAQDPLIARPAIFGKQGGNHQLTAPRSVGGHFLEHALGIPQHAMHGNQRRHVPVEHCGHRDPALQTFLAKRADRADGEGAAGIGSAIPVMPCSPAIA